jgi:hypothetical protein
MLQGENEVDAVFKVQLLAWDFQVPTSLLRSTRPSHEDK